MPYTALYALANSYWARLHQMRINAKATSINDNGSVQLPYNSCRTCLTNCMRSISHHITLLVSNNLGHGHTHAHKRRHIPMIRTVSILRNQAQADLHALDLKTYCIIAIDR